MFYSGLKERLTGPDRPQAVVNFSSGVAAAVAATILTQPADVVRTRMQVSSTLASRSLGRGTAGEHVHCKNADGVLSTCLCLLLVNTCTAGMQVVCCPPVCACCW